MASQEHRKASKASEAAQEENSSSNVDTTASMPVTPKITSDEMVDSSANSAATKAQQDIHSMATEPMLADSAQDDEKKASQDVSDIDRTIKLPKKTIDRLYQTIITARTSAEDHMHGSSSIDNAHLSHLTTLPLLQNKTNKLSQNSTSSDTGLQYRCTIQSKRCRFKLRGIVLPLVSMIVFIVGTFGVLYYSGVHFGSNAIVTVKPSVTITSATPTPVVKPLSVRGSLITGSQGYTNSAQQTVYIDAQKHIQLLSSTDGQRWQQTDLTRLTAAPVANGNGITSYRWDKGGVQQIAYLDAFGHIHLMSSGSDGHWQVIDLTQRASAPLSTGAVLLGYQWTQTGSQQILFLDQAQHIQELVCTDGVTWHVTDLTTVTNTVASNGLALSAFIWTQTEEEHIVYVDADKHVIDLSTTPTGNWQSIDLSETYNAPLSNGNVIAGYEWSVDGTIHIDYIDAHSHIQELSASLQGKWRLNDVTATTNSPVTNGQALAGFDWIQGGSRDLLYIDNNKHIQELSQLPQENWNEVDLTHLTSSSLANGAGLLGYAWSINGSQQVIYVDAEHHLVALSDIANGNWRKVNW